jgi:hypothetical protein
MRSPSSNPKIRRPAVVGLLRATALGILVIVVAIASCLSSAEAHLGESLIAFGDELSKWTSGKLDSKEGRLAINGLTVHRVTASTPLSIKEALDRLGRVCSERGGIENSASLLSSERADASSKLPAPLDGTYRREGKNEGVLACIDTERPLGLTELTRRLRGFGQTGNLSAVGKLRYVLARRQGSVTSLLVLWTDDDAPLLKMFPKTGDAPGSDLPDVPRPDRAERLLSAAEQGSPYSISIYRSRERSPLAVRDRYVKQLQEQGWRVTVTASGSGLTAHRGTRTLGIRVAPSASESTTTSIVELS